MKKAVYLIISFIPWCIISYSHAQNDSVQTVPNVVQHIIKALQALDQCHYKAEMRFKESGGDTFEIRNFSISYKADTGNPLYGYDWEISEEVDSGYLYTFMALPDALNAIFEGTKIIGQSSLPKGIDLGSYVEYIRSFLVLNEVFSPFGSASPDDIVLKASGEYYYLSRQINEMASNQIKVSRDTYLPIQFIETIKDIDFSFVQITEINFIYDEQFMTLPDTTFSIDHYMLLGYTLRHNREPEPSGQEEINSLSPESQELLLYYPFLTETGDTTSIMASDAGYILLDFWYASCAPCLKAMPVLNQLAKDYANKDLRVMGINCFDKGISANLTKKLREKNITIPLLYGSRDLTQALRINSFPTYILITPDRHVEFIEGYTDDVRKVLEQIFNK